MAKMIFNKEETKNIMMMLHSEDLDNQVIAFETLKNVNFKSYIGELLLLYKFAGLNSETWKKNCKVIYDKLESYLPTEALSGPKTLSLIISNNGSKQSIELFMEFFIRDMSKMLSSIGYPIDKFDINIKIKDNE